ncbi:MAG: ATP-binding cassette domain-containing protein [Chloroflexota bacterium]
MSVLTIEAVTDTAHAAAAAADRPTLASARAFSYRHPFASEWCLRDLNFEIKAGETVALIGESGSGKTTLIDCLTGFNPHFYRGGELEGALAFLGEDVLQCDILKLARGYGRVSQDPRTQLFAQQVEDAVAFPMENRALSHAEMERRMQGICEALRITHLRGRDASALSGGESQAVVIASMLVKEPDVMFFDDITSALDPRGQALVKRIIVTLKGQGRTLIVVDPDFDWLSTVADRVLLLDAGRLAFNGPPEELAARPELLLLAGIARPTVNLRPTRLGEPIVAVEDLRYRYGANPAVDGVSFTVRANSVTGIVGHNGSGKSTLAKLLAGLLKPATGHIAVQGRATLGMRAPQMVRLVGYLYQQPGRMFFNKTVAAEVEFAPQALGLANPVTLGQFALAGLEESSPYDLSAGQQQRLALACVLSCDPRIVILDEPTQGLNQQGRRELVALILRLQDEGKTVILISHDMYLVANASEDLLVMDHGQLVRQGPTGELLRDGAFFADLGLPLPWES